MARKKPTQIHHKKTSTHENANNFPTMFFKSVPTNDAQEERAEQSQYRRQYAPGAHTERLIWMWSGVVIVMIVVFLTWAHSLNASGALNIRAWFQKDSLIQESRQSLKYYFEKQNQDRQKMSALADSFLSPTQVSNTALNADQINQLKNRIITSSTPTTFNTPAMFPSSLNKK